MRIATLPDGRSMSDLTARARLRDAAIESFAEAGFDTPYRAIAARAGVSPGLITHHFGSKAALRAECDAEVLRRYHALKTEAIGDPSGYLMERLAVPGAAATILVYLLRAIHAGGQPARDFLDSLVDHARVIMAESVASGLARPSRDEEARLRYLTYQTMGAMLVQFLTAPDPAPDAFVASLRASRQDAILPILELYTEGLFTGPTMLDDYLRYLWEPPDDQARAEPQPQNT
ncbi:TetR/AcrR family transcriptional regulator [Cellulomonas sp. KRMCY2]|uniref:TetR/AcrR family transcriptional regulator n=1 Tax=Cellulomonas sp. KRMCY2 TaxID=1304865 RepID=UPI00045E8AF1|nr:TetR family transcriptional regulator [Cellulomonas sp. KRMCY2]